jgi:bacteriorhodopsin
VEPNKDKPSYVPRHALFFYFFVVWGLYGVAALAPHRLKNTGYNILDLFAKNFFGVYLVSLIFQQPTLASAQPPQQP